MTYSKGEKHIKTPSAGGDPLADTKLGNALTRAIVDTIHEPFLVLDTELRVIVASRSFYEKFQVTQKETQGRLLQDIGNGQWDIPALRHFLKHTISAHKAMKEYKIAHNFLTIGWRTMMLSAREVINEDDELKHLLLTIVDITEKELLDTEKERLSKQKDLMIQEMKHRMANSLQLIASILLLKAQATHSEEARGHLEDAHERIVSIATIERYLDTTSLTEEIAVGPYLTRLCESLGKSMIGGAKPIVLKVIADDGTVTSGEGISLGLITVELVINALKHAFPKIKKGAIQVRYEVRAGGWTLSIADTGAGMQPGPARKEGLGTSIVHSLARQLGAKVDTRTGPKGTTISIVCETPQEAPARLRRGSPVL